MPLVLLDHPEHRDHLGHLRVAPQAVPEVPVRDGHVLDLGPVERVRDGAHEARAVLERYSLDLLRMLVVVTAVATLLTYAQYVQDRGDAFVTTLLQSDNTAGFRVNLLWLTIIPATFAIMRAMVMVETGRYDDPTELATNDPPFIVAAVVYVGLTAAVVFWM